MAFRKLTESETAALAANGCSAADWSAIDVAEGFSPDRVRQVAFSGTCRLGRFEKVFELPGGVRRPAGVYQATLHNMSVGDDALIANVRGYLANYDVGPDAVVVNVDRVYVDGPTAFGNGVEVAVLNETGGREVKIHEGLTAHEAYLEAIYRHRPVLVERLKGFADGFARARTADRGEIGDRGPTECGTPHEATSGMSS